MTTIIWKTAAPFGTCRSRYKARRAQAVAARQREKMLLRRISALLCPEMEQRLNERMLAAWPPERFCLQCGLPRQQQEVLCHFCQPARLKP